MGVKKQAEKSKKQWTKILAVVAGVLFVVLMVVSSMGMSWMTSLRSVQPGDVVVLDYTINDAQGNPMITSDQSLYKSLTTAGKGVILSKQLTVTANQSLVKSVYPVQVYTPQSGWATQYAIFASEYDVLSNSVVGMKSGSTKTVPIISGSPMTQFWSKEQLTKNKLNLTEVSVGDAIALGISENPLAADKNTTSYYLRIGQISEKAPEGVTIDFAHPSYVISVASIT